MLIKFLCICTCAFNQHHVDLLCEIHVACDADRAKLEALCSDLLERTKNPCHQCMKDAGVSANDINEVLLVGGQTRMPKVRGIVGGCCMFLFGRCKAYQRVHWGSFESAGSMPSFDCSRKMG